MTTAVQANNILDRLYEKGARLAGTVAGDVRKFATEQPGKFRRAIVLCVGALLLMVAGHFIIGPVLTDIGDHMDRSQYADKFDAAKAKAQTPADKAALYLLGSCMGRNQWVSTRTAQYLMLDRAEQTCLGQAIGHVVLTGTPEQAQAVAAQYERLGFKLDAKLKQTIGLE